MLLWPYTSCCCCWEVRSGILQCKETGHSFPPWNQSSPGSYPALPCCDCMVWDSCGPLGIHLEKQVILCTSHLELPIEVLESLLEDPSFPCF